MCWDAKKGESICSVCWVEYAEAEWCHLPVINNQESEAGALLQEVLCQPGLRREHQASWVCSRQTVCGEEVGLAP